jgi:DNA topoisomerase VI subunit B
MDLTQILTGAGPTSLGIVVLYFYKRLEKQLEEEKAERREKDEMLYKYLPVITQHLDTLTEELDKQ